MARVLGNPFGEMSGKMGGIVFARNKRGSYIRGYVKPVNPNTESQAVARNSFTSAVTAWHTLDDFQKNLWKSYASSYFSSKSLGNISGGHSGINAFVSLRNSLLNFSRKQMAMIDLAIEINAVPVTAVTQSITVLPLLPPEQPFQPQFLGGLITVNGVNTAFFDSNMIGTIEFGLTTSGGLGPGPTPPSPTMQNIFKDQNGSNMGIAVYASNALAQASQFVQNPEIVLLSSTGLIDNYTTVSAVPSKLQINFDGSILGLQQKTQWVAGQSVRLDAYAYNDLGESARIGTVLLDVSAP